MSTSLEKLEAKLEIARRKAQIEDSVRELMNQRKAILDQLHAQRAELRAFVKPQVHRRRKKDEQQEVTATA